MEDKRRRARVQGAWAGSVKSQVVAQPATSAKSLLHQRPGHSWTNKEHHLSDKQFVFKEPQQVVRRAPEPRVIDKEGVYEISLSPTGISRVCLYPGFVDLKEADRVLEQLFRDIPWKQRTGIRGDVTYQQPRLTAWYGELPYTYSRITMEPNPHWHPVLRTLKNQIEQNTGHTFNSLLCNLYRNEKDSVDWHSDDEPSLGRHPIIASLSFGATRTFEMRKKPPPHRVPREYHSRDLRINLTFRTVCPDPHGAQR
ncbi:alpha-ketoglutarate-dependent dioxygenase alkB homolog 3 isoform X2 [Pteropus vampyrus]|uniref:Alpha-ketoglutarate-dependent dioxygenase alkB homolog 3 isoform X2 n=1 Tax=Pteropus vampyrus TaxID=132908 RepID=A0A6P6CAP2_PTEVA|nr:alpha-ketoglutarate-dependent dioxygenase alkB homolog 3 isoform X2 [Pteropus vampyrus]